MTKWIETTGRTEEDAISAALFQLGLDRDDVSVEVIERAKSGFLGFGGNPAKVRVSYEAKGQEQPREPENTAPARAQEQQPAAPAPREEAGLQPEDEVLIAREEPAAPESAAPAQGPEEEVILARPRAARPAAPARERAREKSPEKGPDAPARVPVSQQACVPAEEDDPKARRIREFLAGLLEHLNVEAAPQISVTSEGGYKVVLQGQGLGAIIGRRGETLDAIQQLTNYAVNRGQSKRVRIHIDAENYRAKREESLRRLAVKVAGKVVRYRKNVTLEAMNAYERHVIHTALQDYPGVTTYSTGTEPNRRTVVACDTGKR
ncbi:MAG: KH domain-containing protein [Lawsonibacter sp.]|nr:KH domain-containing protein [Lawsonibacter sp.]